MIFIIKEDIPYYGYDRLITFTNAELKNICDYHEIPYRKKDTKETLAVLINSTFKFILDTDPYFHNARDDKMKLDVVAEAEIQTETIVNYVDNAIKNATDELHKAYDLFNSALFEDKLPPIALTIQSRGKHLTMGWFTALGWTDSLNTIQMHEINISAESLNLQVYETMKSLLHCMVQLYCHVNEIDFASRNNTYFNKDFKVAAESHGFWYDQPKCKKYGWANALLTDETKRLIDSFDLDHDAFTIARSVPEEKKKKSNSFKWYCPHEECKLNFRSTKKGLNVLCMDHDRKLIMQENDCEDDE